MSLQSWFVKRALRKAQKEVDKMKPLPKWLGWLSTLSAMFGAGGALAGVIPPKYAAIAATVAAVVNALAHSLVGNGVFVPPSK